MSFPLLFSAIAVTTLVPGFTLAETITAPLPKSIYDVTVSGMPTAAQQELRVLRAEVAPGQSTINHMHPFPVTTYVLDGAMIFTIEGQDDVTISAGQAFVEQAGVLVTGKNVSNTETAHFVLFYVSDPEAPFVIHR